MGIEDMVAQAFAQVTAEGPDTPVEKRVAAFAPISSPPPLTKDDLDRMLKFIREAPAIKGIFPLSDEDMRRLYNRPSDFAEGSQEYPDGQPRLELEDFDTPGPFTAPTAPASPGPAW